MNGGLLPNAWHVAAREFGVRAGTRAFVITSAVLAVAVVATVMLPTVVRLFESDEVTRIGLHVGEGADEQQVSAGLEAILAEPMGGPFGADDYTVVSIADPDAAWAAEADELHGILEVRRPGDELSFSYLTDAGPASQTLTLVRQAANSLTVEDRLARAGLGPDQLGALFAPAPFELRGSDEAGPGADEFWGNYLMATAMLVLVLMAIILYGNWVAVSVAEEKSSRVMEMLITSATPRQLMVGKVFGTGAAGLVQYAVIGIAAAAALLLQGPIESALFGAEATAEEPADTALTLETIGVFGLFLLGGFLLYITVYAAAGAMVSRQEDVAHASGPMGFAAMAGYFATLFAMQTLESTWVSVVSLVPFVSPFLMPTRVLLSSVSPIELIAALVILFVSVALALLLAARIYSAGVLLYGQRRGFREVLGATRVPR